MGQVGQLWSQRNASLDGYPQCELHRRAVEGLPGSVRANVDCIVGLFELLLSNWVGGIARMLLLLGKFLLMSFFNV